MALPLSSWFSAREMRPVDDAVAVGVVEGAEDLGDEVDGLPAGDLAAPLVEVLPEGHALHALHNDIL